MLFFDFINPYIVYIFFFLLTVFSIFSIFTYKDFIVKHKKKIYLIVSILLIWTQLARYIGVFFKEDVSWSFWIFNFRILAFNVTTHLPFYMCRFSVVVLLAYTLTGNKKLESFLFYWGALGIFGILYPNGPMDNIANLTETFYIDHFFLTLIPFFLYVYEGYQPSKRDALIITGVMALLLYGFIPINSWVGSDYFYLTEQSVFGLWFPGQSSFVFATVHYLAIGLFFIIYYNIFRFIGKRRSGE